MRLVFEVTQTFDDLELEQQEMCGEASSPMLRRSTSESYLSLTLRLLMSYIYGAPILDVSRSHTTTHHSR